MSKKKRSVGINAILNAIKTCLSVVFPLITFPYASRVLGVDNIGKVSYAQSIEHYFALIATLGITTYAIREGAKIREDKNKLSQFTNEVFTLNVFTSCCSYILMFLLLLVSVKLRNYRLLIILQSLAIIFTTIGVDWLNSIYEDYLLITVRSIVTHVASLIVLFVFVKKPEDYYIYAMLTVMNIAIIGISNLYYTRRYTKIRLFFHKSIFRHLKSSLIFFANSMAVSIYVSADTTMLGWISGDYYVGIYAVSVKVYNIIKTLLASMYIVAIPRLSFYSGNSQMEEFKTLYSKLLMYIALLVMPCVAGLISLSREIVLIVGGKEYSEANISLIILSIGLIFAIFGGMVSNCLNVPLRREMITMKATIISAAVNVVLNIFFIPMLRQNGAAITTVISEVLVFAICVISYKEWKSVLDVKFILKNLLHALIGMISIFVICYLVSFLNIENIYVQVAIKMVLCMMIYYLELIVMKNECAKELTKMLYLKIRKIIGKK